MKPHKIQLTDAARAAAIALKEEGYALRFSVRSQGCCNLSIRIFPERAGNWRFRIIEKTCSGFCAGWMIMKNG